jgi:hypothetical protein
MRPGRGQTAGTALSLLIVLGFGLGLAGGQSLSTHVGRAHSAGPLLLPRSVNGTAYSSYYDAGWYLQSSSVVSNVKGSWIVPKVHGTCGSATTEASVIVGIEGYSGSTYTGAAIGVMVACSGGSPSYTALYEFIPYLGLTFSTMTIHPGNVIFASVSASSATHWVLKLTDLNTSQSLSKTFSHSGGRSAAVWLVGVTSSGGTPIAPLTNFGTVDFGVKYTSVNKTSGATIGTHTGSLAYLVNHGAVASVDTLVKYYGTKVMASTSQIKSDGRSFTVTWRSAGP